MQSNLATSGVNAGSATSSASPPVPACPHCLGERVLWPVGGVPAPVCPWCDDVAFTTDSAPEGSTPDAPPCPDCGSTGAYWFRDVVTSAPLVLICEACAAAEGCDPDADTVLEPTPLAPPEADPGA